jgi:hypothetical protein
VVVAVVAATVPVATAVVIAMQQHQVMSGDSGTAGVTLVDAI